MPQDANAIPFFRVCRFVDASLRMDAPFCFHYNTENRSFGIAALSELGRKAAGNAAPQPTNPTTWPGAGYRVRFAAERPPRHTH